MPVYPCRHPTCTAFVPRRGDGCPDHPREPRADADRQYDRFRRDPAAVKFYHSAAWLKARAAKLATDPVCERCGAAWAKHVHHATPLKECEPDERTAQTNLRALCPPCHNEVEAEAKG